MYEPDWVDLNFHSLRTRKLFTLGGNIQKSQECVYARPTGRVGGKKKAVEPRDESYANPRRLSRIPGWDCLPQQNPNDIIVLFLPNAGALSFISIWFSCKNNPSGYNSSVLEKK